MTEKKLKKQVDQLKRALQEKCAAYDQLKADVAGESPLQLADLLLCLFTLLLVWAVQCSAVQRIVVIFFLIPSPFSSWVCFRSDTGARGWGGTTSRDLQSRVRQLQV